MAFDPSKAKESWVETYFKQQCKKNGASVVKNQRRRGWPDDTVYWRHGVSDLVELKRPKGGRFEPLQVHTIEKLRRMGHSVFVLQTREQVDAYIEYRLPVGQSTHRPSDEYLLSRRDSELSSALSVRPARSEDADGDSPDVKRSAPSTRRRRALPD